MTEAGEKSNTRASCMYFLRECGVSYVLKSPTLFSISRPSGRLGAAADIPRRHGFGQVSLGDWLLGVRRHSVRVEVFRAAAGVLSAA